MKELLTRTVSGLLLVAILLGCIFASSWAYAALLLFIVAVGTFEMSRLLHMDSTVGIAIGEVFSLSTFGIAALVALEVLQQRWLLLELPLLLLPFLYALFSVGMAGPGLVMLVFCLLWANDIFAYLTGRLLGKHKLFPRISPGKTIEGSIGGLVFTMASLIVFCHYSQWFPITHAIGLAAVAVVFGTLGDLCESMLKRQAGVKDSGKLIPGHGGILDRFDSIMFSVPFIFVYLLLL